MPVGCRGTAMLATRVRLVRSMTSTAPGSAPTLSAETNAQRPSGEYATPWGSGLDVGILATSIKRRASTSDTLCAFLLVTMTHRPSAKARRCTRRRRQESPARARAKRRPAPEACCRDCRRRTAADRPARPRQTWASSRALKPFPGSFRACGGPRYRWTRDPCPHRCCDGAGCGSSDDRFLGPRRSSCTTRTRAFPCG